MKDMWDVVVVGGGPAGSATAKACADHGLKTLLLEKQTLPRHKVCTAALMCSMTQTIVKEVFGEPPLEALTIPSYVEGLIVYSPGFEGRKINHRMVNTWRDDLDYWMNQGAKKAGCELWEGTRAVNIVEETGGYKITLKKDGQSQGVKARFVVGADGSTSGVRKSIFPDFIPRFLMCFEEVYQASINLDPKYIHWWVLLPSRHPFTVTPKTWKGDEVLVLQCGARPGESAKKANIINIARDILAKEHGFDLSCKRLWSDGCRDAGWIREVLSGLFHPAKGNVLLVGDASGIKVPITAEGIGTGIRLGLMAADAINKAIHGNGKADGFYLSNIKSLLSELEKLLPPRGHLLKQQEKGVEYLLDAYKEIYDIALAY